MDYFFRQVLLYLSYACVTAIFIVSYIRITELFYWKDGALFSKDDPVHEVNFFDRAFLVLFLIICVLAFFLVDTDPMPKPVYVLILVGMYSFFAHVVHPGWHLHRLLGMVGTSEPKEKEKGKVSSTTDEQIEDLLKKNRGS